MTAVALERGVFTLSLDFELIWGTLDLFGVDGFRRACLVERELVPRLLALLERHRMSATWCIVGHLLLDVPQNVKVGIDGHSELGEVRILGREVNGWKSDQRRELHDNAAEGAGRIEIDANVGIGQVEVRDA